MAWTGNEFDDWDLKDPAEQAAIVEQLQVDTNEALPADILTAWTIYKEKTSTAQARDKAGTGVIPDH